MNTHGVVFFIKDIGYCCYAHKLYKIHRRDESEHASPVFISEETESNESNSTSVAPLHIAGVQWDQYPAGE